RASRASVTASAWTRPARATRPEAWDTRRSAPGGANSSGMSTTWSWSAWTAAPRAIGDRATTTGTGGPVSPDADAARARYACTEAPARAAQTSDAPAYTRDTRDHLLPTCGSFPGKRRGRSALYRSLGAALVPRAN